MKLSTHEVVERVKSIQPTGRLISRPNTRIQQRMDGISLLSTYAESLHQASIVDTEEFTTTRCEQLQLNPVSDSSERDTSSQKLYEVN